MRYALASFVGAIAVVVLAAGGPAESAPERDPSTVQGRVTDSDGQPIAGAFISVSDQHYHILGTAHSRADGRYHVEVAKAGPYHVWAGKNHGYLFRYIPETKDAADGHADFQLAPGANIVIAAYDPNGHRLDNAQFLKASASRVFLTSMTGARGEGTLSAVHTPQSDWQWDKADPALIVVPGNRYRIMVQWEVPGVGKLLYSLDNDGAGYSIAEAGGKLELNLNLEIARSALASLQRDSRANDAATSIAESERDLEAGRADLREHDSRDAVREFAQSLKLSLDAHERLVLAQAHADIDRYRKGKITITVVDAQGKPVPDAGVTYRQVSSDFDFGANPLGRNGAYDEKIASLMQDAGINQTYVTARWGQIEKRNGVFDWSNIDSYQKPARQMKDGFRLLGALSLWFTPNSDFAPAFLHGATGTQFDDAVYRYASKLARRYAGDVGAWEINEFNLKGANIFNLGWRQRVKVGRIFARAVKSADPAAKILNGSLALPYDTPDSRDFYDFLKAGVPTDIVGLELYQAGVNTDGTRVVGLDLVSIGNLLDRYAAFGKPILIKEFSVPSVQVEGSSWWHRPWDEDQQAKFARDVYTIAFSKPLMRGITWSWGVSDADAYILHGGLLDRNMKPKKAYFALKSLLASWRTRGHGTTGSSGTISIRGFAGRYEARVTLHGQRVLSGRFHIVEQKQSRAVLRLRAPDRPRPLREASRAPRQSAAATSSIR